MVFEILMSFGDVNTLNTKSRSKCDWLIQHFIIIGSLLLNGVHFFSQNIKLQNINYELVWETYVRYNILCRVSKNCIEQVEHVRVWVHILFNYFAQVLIKFLLHNTINTLERFGSRHGDIEHCSHNLYELIRCGFLAIFGQPLDHWCEDVLLLETIVWQWLTELN